MKYLRIKDWDKMQHYKHRNPPWVKSYADLLDNEDFYALSDTCKLIYFCLTLFASRKDNRIKWDITWLSRQLPIAEPIGERHIKELIKAGFLSVCDDDSTMLADCYQDAIPERETKTEKEGEADNNYTEIKDYWNSKGNLPAIRSLTKSRCLQLAVRLKESGFGFQWRRIIDIISDTPFCCGENDRGWTANFDWLIKNDSNYTKVLEGTYGASKPQPQPQQTMESQWEQRQGSYIRTAPVAQIKQTEAHNLQNPAFRAWAEKVRPELKEIVL